MIMAVIRTMMGWLKRKARPVRTTTLPCENLARWVSTRGIFVVVGDEFVLVAMV